MTKWSIDNTLTVLLIMSGILNFIVGFITPGWFSWVNWSCSIFLLILVTSRLKIDRGNEND